MAENHANDEYVNPTSRTAAAPIPPETPHDGTGEKRAEEPADDSAKSESAPATRSTASTAKKS